MANQWIKLYTEILHDRKFRKMNERQQLVCLKLFLLAGQEDQGGDLPDLEDISLELYMPNQKQLKADIDRLVELNVISDNGGCYRVINFAKRQEANLTGYERVKRYREKQRDVINDNEVDNIDDNADDVINDNAMITPMITHDNKRRVINDTKMITVEKEIDIDKEIDKEKEIEKDINNIQDDLNTTHIAAEAASHATRSKKAKYTPDQFEFWKRAFGPEAERGKAFADASGIIPIEGEFGHWQKDLRALTEAGIDIPLMTRAVAEQRSRRLTIKSPGSVLTVARELQAMPRQKTNAELLEGISWEGCDDE